MTNDQPSEPHTIAGMANIVFTDPPLNARRGHSIHPWDDIAAALRERPGEWALVLRGIHSSYATQVRRGKLAAFQPPGAFEAVSTKSTVTNDGKPTNDLYIKYVGHEKAQPAANDN